MFFYKILNFIKEDGYTDYKGIDINLFTAGSQVCDFENRVCVVASHEKIANESPDIINLTDTQYKEFKDIVDVKNQSEQGISKLDQMEMALMEMSTLQAIKDAETEQAMMELTMMIGGV